MHVVSRKEYAPDDGILVDFFCGCNSGLSQILVCFHELFEQSISTVIDKTERSQGCGGW